jgi:hypothetical protein
MQLLYLLVHVRTLTCSSFYHRTNWHVTSIFCYNSSQEITLANCTYLYTNLHFGCLFLHLVLKHQYFKKPCKFKITFYCYSRKMKACDASFNVNSSGQIQILILVCYQVVTYVVQGVDFGSSLDRKLCLENFVRYARRQFMRQCNNHEEISILFSILF